MSIFPRASSLSLIAALACALAANACMKPNPIVAELAALEASENDSQEAESDTESQGSESQGDGDSQDSMGSESDTTEPAFVDLGSTACMALDSVDPACGECLSYECCELMLDCSDDADCECVSGCAAAGGSPGQCKQQCGVHPNAVAAYQALVSCSQSACADECPF